MSRQNRIIVVDDHPICATAVSAALASVQRDMDVQTVGSLRDLSTVEPGDDIALILLDLRLPDAVGMSGIETVKESFPGVPVCVMSGQVDTGTMRRAAAQGIAGFIPKTLAFNDLRDAISTVLSGETIFPRMVSDPGAQPTPLSPAEHRIMQALSLGLQNKHIAYELGLSESTVKSHLARIFAKLNVTNRSQAILAFDRLLEEQGGGDEHWPNQGFH